MEFNHEKIKTQYVINNNHLRYILRIEAKRLYYKENTHFYISKKSEVSRLECMKIVSNDVKKYAKKILPSDKFDFDAHSDFEYDYYFEQEFK